MITTLTHNLNHIFDTEEKYLNYGTNQLQLVLIGKTILRTIVQLKGISLSSNICELYEKVLHKRVSKVL